MVVFAKGAHYALESLSKSGYNVVGLDWTIEPQTARLQTNNLVSLQVSLFNFLLYFYLTLNS